MEIKRQILISPSIIIHHYLLVKMRRKKSKFVIGVASILRTQDFSLFRVLAKINHRPGTYLPFTQYILVNRILYNWLKQIIEFKF